MNKLGKLLCRLGMHKKQKCSAKFVLMEQTGFIESWVCKRCEHKSEDGTFIPDKIEISN